ncbi:class GN sortase [Pseudoalteromonas sp. BDTF-M6]|uniref:class GN sortase n=1 Tax=Pseudoalteromonas sp. BDTF-M6 TaxID=2796132 RepID=UPI001BB0D4F1|nr:class GN sortase [Pseudoalteromonas sp. BDTF-M6]MBS3798321.1 class GN sortase [Pseudoalteromonas sp. BDTF-M6]
MAKGKRVAARASYWRYGAIALFALGASFFAQGAYMQSKAWLAQWLIERAWQQSLAAPGANIPPWYYADTHVVAKLTVPHLALERFVLAGSSGRNLAFAPTHDEAFGPLGGEGASVIAAHNDTHFAFLRHVQVGDELSLTLRDGRTLSYRIASKQVVHQSDTQAAAASGLHLVTCYPFNSPVAGTDLRLLVSASLISSSSRSTTNA